MRKSIALLSLLLLLSLVGCSSNSEIISAKGEDFQIKLPKGYEEVTTADDLNNACAFTYHDIKLRIIKNEGVIANCKEMITSFVSGYAVYGETTKPNIVTHSEDGISECAAGNFIYKEPDKNISFYCKAIKKNNILYLGVIEIDPSIDKSYQDEMKDALQTLRFKEDK